MQRNRILPFIGFVCLIGGIAGVASGYPDPKKGKDCVVNEFGGCRKFTGNPDFGCCPITDNGVDYLVFIAQSKAYSYCGAIEEQVDYCGVPLGVGIFPCAGDSYFNPNHQTLCVTVGLMREEGVTRECELPLCESTRPK